MTATVSVNYLLQLTYMKCDECMMQSDSFNDTPQNRIHVGVLRDEHNEAKHPAFKPAVLANLGSLGNGYHVSAEDFTESHHGAEERTTPEQAIEAWSERVKELRSKADARDLDAAKEQIRALKMAANTRIAQMRDESIEQNNLIKDLRETIDELLATPEPMPLCKNPEGHNYLPLDHMFVFCNRCGHSIHYKAKD